jgi:hypothetical protein
VHGARDPGVALDVDAALEESSWYAKSVEQF